MITPNKPDKKNLCEIFKYKAILALLSAFFCVLSTYSSIIVLNKSSFVLDKSSLDSISLLQCLRNLFASTKYHFFTESAQIPKNADKNISNKMIKIISGE